METQTRLVKWLNRPCSRSSIFFVVLAGHIYGLCVLQGTFWVDSEAYIIFSKIFESKIQAASVYRDPANFIYSHLVYGLSFFWFLLTKLQVAWIWPVLAVGQHLLALLATLYVFFELNRIIPSKMLIVGCFLLSFLPFYQSMHNTLMTESISGSCALFLLGAGLRLARLKQGVTLPFIIFLVATVVGSQVRYYLLGVSVCLIMAVFWRTRPFPWGKCLIVGLVCLASGVMTPAYRMLTGGSFSLPSLELSVLTTLPRLVPETPPEVVAYAETVPWPDPSYHEALLKGPLDDRSNGTLMIAWSRQGLGREDIARICRNFKELYLSAKGTSPRRAAAALVCLGVPEVLFALPDNWIPVRSMTGAMLARHCIGHYRYLSWITPNEQDYRALTDRCFDHTPETELFLKALTPYMHFRNTSVNDPFGIGRISPGIFFLLGLCSLAVLILNARWLLVIVLGLPLVMYAVLYYIAGLAGIRYVYLPMINYCILISISLAVIGERLGTRRLPNFSKGN